MKNYTNTSKPSNSAETNPTEGQFKDVSKKGYDLDMSGLLCDGDGDIEAPKPVSTDAMSTQNDSFDSKMLSHNGSDNGSPLKDSLNSSDSFMENWKKKTGKVLALTIHFLINF